jgi:hypothetical protein
MVLRQLAAYTAMVLSIACGSVSPEAPAGEEALEADQGLGAKVLPMKEAKLLIEHNFTEEDTGFQGFVDGEPWRSLTIRDPFSRDIMAVTAKGQMSTFGFTELFFETQEPPNAEVPIRDVLARLPEGQYTFRAVSIDGEPMRGTTTLSHAIPKGPTVLSHRTGDVVSTEDMLVRWAPVTRALDNQPITIRAYQVIVVKAAEVQPTPGFFKETFSVHLKPTATSVEVPEQFLRPNTTYDMEVFAIAANGNQTFTLVEFRTR